MSDVPIRSLATAQNWFVKYRLPDGSEMIEPLACWALLDDGELVGMVARANTVQPARRCFTDFTYVWPQRWDINKDGTLTKMVFGGLPEER